VLEDDFRRAGVIWRRRRGDEGFYVYENRYNGKGPVEEEILKKDDSLYFNSIYGNDLLTKIWRNVEEKRDACCWKDWLIVSKVVVVGDVKGRCRDFEMSSVAVM
jgi:hypothetical protein